MQYQDIPDKPNTKQLVLIVERLAFCPWFC